MASMLFLLARLRILSRNKSFKLTEDLDKQNIFNENKHFVMPVALLVNRAPGTAVDFQRLVYNCSFKRYW